MIRIFPLDIAVPTMWIPITRSRNSLVIRDCSVQSKNTKWMWSSTDNKAWGGRGGVRMRMVGIMYEGLFREHKPLASGCNIWSSILLNLSVCPPQIHGYYKLFLLTVSYKLNNWKFQNYTSSHLVYHSDGKKHLLLHSPFSLFLRHETYPYINIHTA